MIGLDFKIKKKYIYTIEKTKKKKKPRVKCRTTHGTTIEHAINKQTNSYNYHLFTSIMNNIIRYELKRDVRQPESMTPIAVYRVIFRRLVLLSSNENVSSKIDFGL